MGFNGETHYGGDVTFKESINALGGDQVAYSSSKGLGEGDSKTGATTGGGPWGARRKLSSKSKLIKQTGGPSKQVNKVIKVSNRPSKGGEEGIIDGES